MEIETANSAGVKLLPSKIDFVPDANDIVMTVPLSDRVIHGPRVTTTLKESRNPASTLRAGFSSISGSSLSHFGLNTDCKEVRPLDFKLAVGKKPASMSMIDKKCGICFKLRSRYCKRGNDCRFRYSVVNPNETCIIGSRDFPNGMQNDIGVAEISIKPGCTKKHRAWSLLSRNVVLICCEVLKIMREDPSATPFLKHFTGMVLLGRYIGKMQVSLVLIGESSRVLQRVYIFGRVLWSVI